MAERRMFSKKIVQTDAFLDMPPTTQLLYFQLNMEGDDDGFVAGPRKIMRVIGSTEDDLKLLLAKRFLISFPNGVIVIKHWFIHNYIQKDRYHETKYLDEKKSLLVKENGAYTECIQDVYKMDTEIRLGKDRLNKDKEYIPYGEFQNVHLTPEEYEKLIEKYGEQNTKLLIAELDTGIASKGYRYKSHYATILNWARRKYQEHQKDKLKAKEKYIA